MISIPKHKDFQKVYNNFITEYGKEKGESLYYAYINKHKYDDTKPMPGNKSSVANVEFTECKGEFYSQGFVATTHIDDKYDKISKDTLVKWADEINKESIKTTPVDLEHDFVFKGNDEANVLRARGKEAEVKPYGDGEYGLFVKTHHNKMHPSFESDKYQIEQGFLAGYSIEFNTHDNETCHYEFQNGKQIRVLEPSTDLRGWALTARPLNGFATIEGSEEKSHSGNVMLVELKTEKGDIMEPTVEVTAQVVPEPKLEVKSEEKKEVDVKNGQVVKTELKSEPVETKPIEVKAEVIVDKVVKKIIETKNIPEALANIEVKKQVQLNVGENMNIETKSYVDSMKSGSIDLQFKNAGALADSLGLTKTFVIEHKAGVDALTRKSNGWFKNFQTNGQKLECKALGTTTNQNTDTDYLLSAAELADVFDPVVYNALNEKTTLWGVLNKDDYSNKGNDFVQFSLKIAANQTAGSVAIGNIAVNTGNTTRIKYETKFKQYQAGVAVDGRMIAAARGGPIGDVFALEVQDATETLMSVMNIALFGTAGTETDNDVIGLQYITDSASYATLYNVTRSATNKLLPASASDTYINGSSANITLALLRQSIRQCITDGSDLNNLVFVCHPLQADKIKALFDDVARIVPPKMSRFGFETMLYIDGVPVFVDKDCTNSKIYCVDTAAHRIAIWVPPTLEMLGKRSDSEEGFIKCYWAVYNRAPRRCTQIYSLKTT